MEKETLSREEKRQEYHKQYYEKNKEKIKKYTQQWRAENKDKIAEGSRQYYENNKDRLNDYSRDYYAKNKGRINGRRRKHHGQCAVWLTYEQIAMLAISTAANIAAEKQVLPILTDAMQKKDFEKLHAERKEVYEILSAALEKASPLKGE